MVQAPRWCQFTTTAAGVWFGRRGEGVRTFMPLNAERTLPILAVLLCLGALFRTSPDSTLRTKTYHSEDKEQESRLGAYRDSLSAIDGRRRELLLEYQSAESEDARAGVLRKAHEEIFRSVVESIIPFWYGTPWDFYGTTQEPGIGAIACGYFVTTVLRDAGFAVDLVGLAQQPSELIIRSLVGPGSIRCFSNVPMGVFAESVETWGPGLYVVGLDIHVGFIVHDSEGIHFLHSAYAGPLCVVREQALSSPFLEASRYRVLGKLTGERGLAMKWLTGGQIHTRKR